MGAERELKLTTPQNDIILGHYYFPAGYRFPRLISRRFSHAINFVSVAAPPSAIKFGCRHENSAILRKIAKFQQAGEERKMREGKRMKKCQICRLRKKCWKFIRQGWGTNEIFSLPPLGMSRTFLFKFDSLSLVMLVYVVPTVKKDNLGFLHSPFLCLHDT